MARAPPLESTTSSSTSLFIKPAKIQVLLVPIHPIKTASFERYANLIRGFSRIQLADVPPDTRGDRAIFSSSPTTPGALLFDYLTPTTYASSHPLSFLSEFQIHRRVHGIIGILDCSEYDSKNKPLSLALAGFHNSLKDLPTTFTTKVYGFDSTEAQVTEARGIRESEGLVMIPATGDVGFYLNTLLADFASAVLYEFSNLAAQLESRTSIPTPQDTAGVSSPFTYIPHRPTAKSTISTYASTAVVPTGPKAQRPINLESLGIAAPPQSRTAMGQWGASQSGNQDGFLYGMSIQSNMAVQPGAAPTLGVAAGSGVDPKARKRVLGREKKLMADMWLLAGRLNEAITCYNEAIALLKAWQDQVWQASALEGLTIALVIQAWTPVTSRFDTKPSTASITANPSSASNTSAIPASDSSGFLSSIPERLGQAITLYSKMLTPLSNGEDQPPPDPDRAHPLVYAEACLRCARFLLAVWESGGWIERALDRLVLPPAKMRGESKTSEEQARAARLVSLAPTNTVPRSSIALWTSMAYSPQLSTLALPIRLRITGEIASIFGRIGYRRKESFVLRELAALCGEGVAGKEIEVFSAESATPPRSSTPSTIVEEDEQALTRRTPTARLKKLRIQSNNLHGPSIVRTSSDSAGNESIVRLAEKVCEAFGIDVVPRANAKGAQTGAIQGRPKGNLDTQDRFGWPLLQVGILTDAIGIAEALPDYQAAIRFTVTALRSLSDTMSPAEQYRLSQNIPRIFAAATRRGAAFDLEYWGPNQLVMSLEMAPLSANSLPFEHPYEDVESNAKATSAAIESKDPFIYNPKKGPTAARARPTVVQSELAEVFVTLQNPFLFDLDVQSIELSTSGVPFTCDPLSTSIPAGSFHTVRLSGTPLEAGLLTIRGCNIRLSGCTSREFVLPVSSEDEEARRQKDAAFDASRARTKRSGLVAVSTFQMAPVDEKDLKFLVCNVVPEMPLLAIRSTSLTHGALMLYDGETTTIRIGLENTSTSPVDFVKLTFSDMHTSSTQNYVDENELSPAMAHEIEAENLHRPVFTWRGSSAPKIAPGESTVLEVQCLGKMGCGTGTIQLDYAYISRDVTASSGTFHTRQLFCDVFMTVHRALVAHSLEVLRFKVLPDTPVLRSRTPSVISLGKRGAAIDKTLEDSLRDVDSGDHCLVSVDVMNAYGAPFEVAFGRSESDGETLTPRQRLEPGATARMLVQLERIVISAETLAQPIPSLSKRQFIVAKVKRTVAEERLSRELFWYREELLNRIQASWNEVGSLRSGTISLRSLDLTKSMLDVLRGDEVDIYLTLQENASSSCGVVRRDGQSRCEPYSIAANDFMDVCARVVNNSASPLELTLRLSLRPPSSSTSSTSLSHLSRYIIIDGLSLMPVRLLRPGEEAEVRVSICILAEGVYELGCAAQELKGDDAAEGRWVARDPLVINVDR